MSSQDSTNLRAELLNVWIIPLIWEHMDPFSLSVGWVQELTQKFFSSEFRQSKTAIQHMTIIWSFHIVAQLKVCQEKRYIYTLSRHNKMNYTTKRENNWGITKINKIIQSTGGGQNYWKYFIHLSYNIILCHFWANS